MRRFAAALAAAVLALTVSASFAEKLPEPADRVPEEYTRPAENGGTVEKIEYPSRDYAGGGAEVTKRAVVYLPYGYTEENQYDVLVLCHGSAGDENEWGFTKDSSIARNIADHLMEDGAARPWIIVMPDGRSGGRGEDGDIRPFFRFGEELRNDLLPWIDAHYSTYGTREHRGMAGLSIGAVQTVNIGLCECPDLFAFFGAFSVTRSVYPAERIAAALEAAGDECPVLLFYSVCGQQDKTAYASAKALAENLPGACGQLTADHRVWQEVPGGHDFSVWYLGLYNFLRLAAN